MKTRREIAKEYLQFWFWVDLLATIPWELFVTAKGTGLLPLFKLLRIGRCATSVYCVIRCNTLCIQLYS
jgi:hypothetical protein